MAAKLTIADRLAGRNPQGALARAKELKEKGEGDRAFKLFTIAAEAGLVEAQGEVGNAYLRGVSTARSLSEGVRWLTRAADAGDTASQLALAGLYAGGFHETHTTGSAALFADVATPAQIETPAEPDYDNALKWALKAAEAGDGDAAAMLGYLYLMLPGERRDEAEAKRWYAKAADAGKPQGYLGLGILTLSRAETDEPTFEGVALITKATEADLPTAHYYMAMIYERGVGVRPDLAKAVMHYGIAAKANIRDAMAKYGHALFSGHGIRMNQVEGETWLRRAGLAGDPEAALIVANHYANGDGKIDPNYTEAALWFRIAADKGRPEAARALGVLYLTGAGVTRDADEAAKWFRHAAENGNVQAQADLATLMLKGRVNPHITEPAPVHEWFEKAAGQGDPIGAYNYGICLSQGVGVERDDAKAAECFRIAAETVLNAQYQLARFLAEGRGVKQDLAEARVWMKKVADTNMQEGLMDYAALLLQGLGGERDDATARDLFERAAEIHGNADALFALGALYGGGHQIEADREKSLAYYRRAAEKGHARAALMLGKYMRFGIATPVDLDEARKWFTVAAQKGLPEEAKADLDAMDAPPPSATPDEAA